MTLLNRFHYEPIQAIAFAVPKEINASDISIIVPVKNNQTGITTLLATLAAVIDSSTMPREVIIIDNLSAKPIEIAGSYPFPVILTTCKIVGPAAARNKGVSLSSGNWLLFLDSDCIPTKETISGYLTQDNVHVAYAGNINIMSEDRLSKYYASEDTLIPRRMSEHGKEIPSYLVTANCLIYKGAFDEVSGFDESFSQAGGEDVDLAFRLRRLGTLEYQWASHVYHSFDDGLSGFIKRFHRYGKGNKQLSIKYAINLFPKPEMPQVVTPTNITLSLLKFFSVSYGYFSK